jgi:hypothetical protein
MLLVSVDHHCHGRPFSPLFLELSSYASNNEKQSALNAKYHSNAQMVALCTNRQVSYKQSGTSWL